LREKKNKIKRRVINQMKGKTRIDDEGIGGIFENLK
jgi:hypothetical protein